MNQKSCDGTSHRQRRVRPERPLCPPRCVTAAPGTSPGSQSSTRGTAPGAVEGAHGWHHSANQGRAPLLPTACGTGVPTGLLPAWSNTPGTQALTAVGDAVPGPLSTKGLLHSLTQISSFAPSHSPRLLGRTPFSSTPEQPSWRGWLQPCTGPASPF